MQTEISEPTKLETNTLLSKYGIPVGHLDYEYIYKCDDPKELEKIVQILRSNEEGFYPHLTKVAEERLQNLKPKSKLLRKNVEVIRTDGLNTAEKEEIKSDLREFVEKMSNFDSELITRGKSGVQTTMEIRQPKEAREINKKNISNRIKSTDYASWDKYDVDTECLKIDLEEEKLKKTIKLDNKTNVIKPAVQFSTNAEAEFEANREKIKGNESYKNNDYEQAIEHYTNSIKIKPVSTTYTNRAIANIKIKNYGDAIQDCKAALKLDGKNIKAYVRLAEIYEFLKKYADAIENIDNALILDPNNVTVQNIAARLEKHRNNKKKMRFKIQEMTTTKTVMRSECEIPIPGTSNMDPPFYVVGNSNVQFVRKKVQPLYFVNISNDLDAEECTVNHLEHRCSMRNKIESKKSLFIVPVGVKNKENGYICENGSGDSNKVRPKTVNDTLEVD